MLADDDQAAEKLFVFDTVMDEGTKQTYEQLAINLDKHDEGRKHP
jgi:hypothetical protein